MNRRAPPVAANALALLCLAAALLVGAMPASAAEVVGRVLLARGEATATDAGGGVRALARRAEVFEADTLATGADGTLQVRFDDGALLSLRSASRVEVAVYRHDRPAEGADAVLLRVLQGGIRTITGAIGADPEAYEVRTPVASIGIRGTHYEAVQESETVWVFGLWEGGVRVYNEHGAVNLGRDADFLYARTEAGYAPEGVTLAPDALREETAGAAGPRFGFDGGPGGDAADGGDGTRSAAPTPGPEEEAALRSALAGDDGAPGAADASRAAAVGAPAAGAPAAAGPVPGGGGPAAAGVAGTAPAGADASGLAGAGAEAGTSGAVGVPINPAEGADDLAGLRDLSGEIAADPLSLSDAERIALQSAGRRAVLLFEDGRVVTGRAATGTDGERLVLLDGPGPGATLLRSGGATVVDGAEGVGGFDVSWGTLVGGTGARLASDGAVRALEDDVTFVDIDATGVADLTVQASYAGDTAIGTTSAGAISDFGIFFDADLDLGSGRISEGHLLLEAGEGVEEYRVNFEGLVSGGEASLQVTSGRISGSGIDGLLDVDRDASALNGLFTDGGEGFAGGFFLEESGNPERFARGGFVAEKEAEVGSTETASP
jgi:hypothetical protein